MVMVAKVFRPNLVPLHKILGPKGGLAVLASALTSAGGLQAQGSVFMFNGVQNIIPISGTDLRPLGQADVQSNRPGKLLPWRDFIRTRENAFYSFIAHVVFCIQL